MAIKARRTAAIERSRTVSISPRTSTILMYPCSKPLLAACIASNASLSRAMTSSRRYRPRRASWSDALSSRARLRGVMPRTALRVSSMQRLSVSAEMYKNSPAIRSRSGIQLLSARR